LPSAIREILVIKDSTESCSPWHPAWLGCAIWLQVPKVITTWLAAVLPLNMKMKTKWCNDILIFRTKLSLSLQPLLVKETTCRNFFKAKPMSWWLTGLQQKWASLLILSTNNKTTQILNNKAGCKWFQLYPSMTNSFFQWNLHATGSSSSISLVCHETKNARIATEFLFSVRNRRRLA